MGGSEHFWGWADSKEKLIWAGAKAGLAVRVTAANESTSKWHNKSERKGMVVLLRGGKLVDNSSKSAHPTWRRGGDKISTKPSNFKGGPFVLGTGADLNSHAT